MKAEHPHRALAFEARVTGTADGAELIEICIQVWRREKIGHIER